VTKPWQRKYTLKPVLAIGTCVLTIKPEETYNTVLSKLEYKLTPALVGDKDTT